MAPTQLDEVHDRSALIPAYDVEAWSHATVNLIGSGGIGFSVALLMVRKALRTLRTFDGDMVEASNLNRAFHADDVGKPKAHALARNVKSEATLPTKIIAYPWKFEEVAQYDVDLCCDVAVCAIDNDAGRLFASAYFLARRIPCVFVAVDREAGGGYCFVQESKPGSPCWLCLMPEAAEMREVDQRCAGSEPGLLSAMAGITSYAIDSLLMPRKRSWNYFELFLNGMLNGGGPKLVMPRPNCPVCSQFQKR